MTCYLQIDPDPAGHFDVDADPDPAYYFDADPDPYPTLQFDVIHADPNLDSQHCVEEQQIRLKNASIQCDLSTE